MKASLSFRLYYIFSCIGVLLVLFPFGLAAQEQWSSKWVYAVAEDKWQYTADERGNIIPDFSRVGYQQGRQVIPVVPVVRELFPTGKDDQLLIQSAIDELSREKVKANGFRGAILLRKGTYRIPGTLRIHQSGIVLRGEGDSTILIATGRGQRTLLSISGKGSGKLIVESKQAITDEYVPVGAFSFTVKESGILKAGDRVVVRRPGTAQWISAIRMDQIERRDSQTRQWRAAEYDLCFERVITSIEGNRISIDNPVMMAMEKIFGGGEILRYEFDGRICNAGVENLQFVSSYNHSTDEDHGWNAVSFNRVENGWARNITAKHFGYSCVNLGSDSRQITVDSCRSLEPISKITGGRRYSFNNDGQLNLVMNCFASGGRHDYVTGAKTVGPNVFYNCRAEKTNADIGPHHRWAVGTLYDNIITDGEINVQDRGNWGTGHGWAGVTQVIWNCKGKSATVQNPWASGKNFIIGFIGKKTSGRLPDRPEGEWEGHNRDGLFPISLYEIQVKSSKK